MTTVPTTAHLVRRIGAQASAIALRLDAASRALRISAAPRPLVRRSARRNAGGESVSDLLARLVPAVAVVDAPPIAPIRVAGPVTAPLVVPGLRPALTAGGTR